MKGREIFKNNLQEKMIKLMAERMVITSKKVTLMEIEREVADSVGITIDGVRNIKKGNANPSLQVAYRLAKYFNCKIEDIFSE